MGTQSVYRQIYNDLMEKIIGGQYAAGDRIPSETELCDTYGVSRITSKRALDLLADEGLIIRKPGKGSFVISNNRIPSGASDSKSIGFILPDFSDSFGTKLLYSIEESCKTLGYHLILKRTRDQVAEEEEAIKALSGAAGILLIPVHGALYNSEILKLIIEKRALVFVDRKMRGLAAPTITTNNLEAAEEGTNSLFQLGHRNIAFFSGPVSHTSTVEDRHQGYIQAHAKFGLRHNPAYICQNLSSAWSGPYYTSKDVSADIEIVKKHLKTHPEISAAFTSEYIIAQIVKDAAEALGRKIAKDFSIVTFDTPPSITEIPPFTHMRQDEYAMGKEAVQTLERIIAGNFAGQAEDILIPAKLVNGSSTGAMASGKGRKNE